MGPSCQQLHVPVLHQALFSQPAGREMWTLLDNPGLTLVCPSNRCEDAAVSAGLGPVQGLVLLHQAPLGCGGVRRSVPHCCQPSVFFPSQVWTAALTRSPCRLCLHPARCLRARRLASPSSSASLCRPVCWCLIPTPSCPMFYRRGQSGRAASRGCFRYQSMILDVDLLLSTL